MFEAARIYALGGARTAPVLVDEGGVSLRSLEMSDAQILHTSPNHQFPTGAVTPIGRRQSLLRWAEAREGRYIIEDDYDSEFRFTLRPIPTLQSIDRAGRVIYVNTFSRTLAPSLRISYMVLPKSLTERYRAQLGFYSSTVPAMEQHTLARFLDEGYFEAHINRMRKSYRAQRDAVIDTILQSRARTPKSASSPTWRPTRLPRPTSTASKPVAWTAGPPTRPAWPGPFARPVSRRSRASTPRSCPACRWDRA